jgi:hypothetical protein
MKKTGLAIILLMILIIAALSGCSGGTGTTPLPSTKVNTGDPAKLFFVTQPEGGTAGTPLRSQPVIEIQDADGNVVEDSILPVRLAVFSGTEEIPLFGPKQMNAVNGIARFNNLIVEKMGNEYTIKATCGELIPAVSASFNIDPGEAARLEITVQPSNCIAGSPFDVQPEVIVQDNYGNKIIDYEGSVTLGITYGSGVTGAKLLGNTTVQVENGIAKFKDLSIDRSYPYYKLTAMSGSLALVGSQFVRVSAGTPTMLEFTVLPEGIKAGKAFDTQPKVAIEDKYGNVLILPGKMLQ